MPYSIKMGLLHAEKQGEATMKQHSAIFIAVILIIAVTNIALVMRKDLCEVRIKTGLIDVAVLMACESVK